MTGHVLAIDPGPAETAYALIGEGRRPIRVAKVPNAQLLDELRHMPLGLAFDHAAIEMVASYGMAVGAEVFETCVWIGRYAETIHRRTDTDPALVKRLPVKVHHCHDSRAKDSNITQALIDRFAAGQPNRGKGTNAQPGFFHGFKADIWQAYALAVYVADTHHWPTPRNPRTNTGRGSSARPRADWRTA